MTEVLNFSKKVSGDLKTDQVKWIRFKLQCFLELFSLGLTQFRISLVPVKEFSHHEE